MDLVGGLLVVFGFIGLAKAFALVDKNLKVIEIARSAASIVGDKRLDDLQKEQTLQQNAKELLLLFLVIVGTSLAALGIPVGVVWVLDVLGVLSFEGVITTLTSTWFILATVGVSLLYLFLAREKTAESSEHTQLDRNLHTLAFETWFPRVSLSKIESRLYRSQLAAVSIEKPVFITALPRAGTTLILKLCVELDEFATHTYSDMPFLLSPLAWNRFTRKHRDAGVMTERVHGDGILVNADSPESFEEILWKEFWPSYYKEDRILPWSEAPYPDFEAFFREHMRKIILLRGQPGDQVRYISKNNLNISRIKYLRTRFPESILLILFRAPLQHASSLLKQHRNFLAIHRKDRFAQQYMADTGHYDFGENLRPVDFKGWLEKGGENDPVTLEFWLQYWINAYRYLLRGNQDQVHFFSFDALCADPQWGLERLGAIAAVQNRELLLEQVDRIRQPKPHPVYTTDIPANLISQSEDIYRELTKVSNS